MRRKYVECQCGTVEHTLRFTWDDDPDWPEVYVDVHLGYHYGIFKRIWYGLKYIFGFKSRYGQFDEAILGHKEVTQIKELCDEWLETHPKEKEDKLRIAKVRVRMAQRELEKLEKT